MTDDPAPRIVRRRRGPFKRSRTGCGTCKRRGKKCDEVWNEDGFCQRCLAGPWECTGQSTGPSRQNTAPAVAMGHSSMVMGSSSSASVLPNSVGVPTPLLTPPEPSTSISPNGLVPWGTESAPAMATSSLHASAGAGGSLAVATGAGPSHAPHASHASLPLPQHATGSTQFGGMWNGYVHPTDTMAAAPRFQPMPSLSPYDWVTTASTTGGTAAAGPSTVLSTSPDSLATASQPAMSINNRLTDLWSDLGSSFTPPLSNTNPQLFPPNSRLFYVSGDRPMRQGMSLAEIYARVVESWLVGLPSETREYARARILALHDTNIRYAVAAAYILLFENSDSKLMQIVEYRGGAVLDGGRRRSSGPSVTSSNGSREGKDAEGGAFNKIRLYIEHVSTPFASDFESKKWTEDAINELRHVAVTDRSQLSDSLWGVMDLQLVEFIRGGAAPSYSMLALGDRLVHSAFGVENPSLSLSEMRQPETFSLRLYALSDISRCIVHRGRRTMFNFWAENRGPLTTDEETWSSYLSLPDPIVVLLAEIVNLCADQHAGVAAASISTRAREIEDELRRFVPAKPTSPSSDSSALVLRTTGNELWRLCALILLYQSVHRVGGLHPVLRRAQGELLQLLGSITQLPNGELWGFIGLPAFLAAALSVTDTDRKRAMAFLVRPGPERVWLDNIALVEKIWEEVDETGCMVEWYDKMVREGLSVAFF